MTIIGRRLVEGEYSPSSFSHAGMLDERIAMSDLVLKSGSVLLPSTVTFNPSLIANATLATLNHYLLFEAVPKHEWSQYIDASMSRRSHWLVECH
jgi:hypothetical protein